MWYMIYGIYSNIVHGIWYVVYKDPRNQGFWDPFVRVSRTIGAFTGPQAKDGS